MTINKKELANYFSRLGRKGGKARGEKLSEAQRRAIATKASKAAAVARATRAKQK